MQEQIEILQKPTKDYQKPTKYLQKTLEAMALVSNGADYRTALQITNNKRDIADVTVNKFKAKYKKYSLIAPTMVRAASNQVKRILTGEVREIDQQKVTKDGEVVDYKEQIAPSDTNILAAAAMVYDRYEPAIKQTVQINIDVDPVDLSKYLNSSAKQGLEHNRQTLDIINNDDRV